MQIFNVTWKWNIPNVLSLLRIALVPVFMVLYLSHQYMWAFAALLLSGLSDAVDGFIARRFNQITDCGKLLDPIADKLTQVAVVISLATHYPELWPLAVLCFVKETCQAIGGAIMLKRNCEVRGSKWFGKVSTVVFYGSMLSLVLFTLPDWAVWLLIGLAGTCMLVAFVGYLRIFIQVSREGKPASADAEKG
ncbi:MAG: CDP-alcohol phosphatidyltransferase family protein [Clostridia bacterium]|nr:CDP-alcohol phosphatidyltransferase family protein [Clostridia bacterium]